MNRTLPEVLSAVLHAMGRPARIAALLGVSRQRALQLLAKHGLESIAAALKWATTATPEAKQRRKNRGTNAYSEAFKAALSHIVMMAGFMAGSGKLTKRQAGDMRTLVGGMMGDAERDLYPEAAERLRDHARAVMEDLLARLGTP